MQYLWQKQQEVRGWRLVCEQTLYNPSERKHLSLRANNAFIEIPYRYKQQDDETEEFYYVCIFRMLLSY